MDGSTHWKESNEVERIRGGKVSQEDCHEFRPESGDLKRKRRMNS